MSDRPAHDVVTRALTRWFADLNHQGIVATDAQLRVVTWNRWMEVHSGITAAQAVGHSLLELFPDLVERGVDEYYRSALEGRVCIVSYGLHRYILPLRPTLHELHMPQMPQSARISPLWDGDSVVGTATLIDDVSDRLGNEIELRKQIDAQERAREAAEQALRAKDEFLSTVSHEIRQPLNAVLGWTRILRDDPNADGDLVARALQVIDRNATVQARMIDDLLDMARIVTGKLRLEMEPVDLTSVTVAAIDVVAPAATSKKIAIRTSLDPASPRVLGDHARLQQVIWNLLSNAVKFTEPGGTIDVTVSGHDHTAYVSVHDTGRGITAEFLPFVFDRFRQADASSGRREGGLGLGLALVREVVELHGGSVRATSPGAGKGTTFAIELPAANITVERPPELDVALQAEAPSLDGVHVLVVEDQPDARDLMVTALEHCGAQVIAASSSAEAVRLLARAAADQRPMVVVSDIGLPREDGYALIEQIRALPPERGGAVPAVAVTGYANPEDRDRALAAGYQLHVGKPIDPQAIARAVARVIGKAMH